MDQEAPKIELDLERATPAPAPKPAWVAPPPIAQPREAFEKPAFHDDEAPYRIPALRVAGFILLLNIGLTVWLLNLGHGSASASLVVDLALMPLLLLGKDAVRKWALIRTVLGLVFGSVLIYMTTPDTPYTWVVVVLNMAYCAGLILLLTGEDPGLGRLIGGGALSGLSIGLIFTALAFVQATLNKEPSPQTAFGGRISMLGFDAFQTQPQALPPGAEDKFEETGLEQAITMAGSELIWVRRPKAGITMDPDKVLRSAYRSVQAKAGQGATEVKTRSESHGSLDGEGLSATLTAKGVPIEVRMFIAQQGDTYWTFLVLVPAQRGPALADRILDSIQIND